MDNRFRRRLNTSVSRIAVVAAAITLSGCGGLLTGADEQQAPQLVRPDPQDAASSAAYWGAVYEADRNNLDAALQFARNLRQVGGPRQAVALLKEIVMRAPDNAQILSEYGKALTESGRPADAIPFFARALQGERDDWTLHSAYAVALDQTGKHAAAQASYEAALALSPQNAIVQGNLAMSFILAGDLPRGEQILRELVARPDSTPQMRQNLAMVASLRGNREEAESLSGQDLSQADTDHNLMLIEQMSVENTTPVADRPVPAPAPDVTGEPAEATEPPQQTSALAPAPAGPEDTILPLTSPGDMSVLPLPARMAAEMPRPEQVTAIAEAPPAAQPAAPPRRPIMTMKPIADEAPAPARDPQKPRIEAAGLPAPAATPGNAAPLRRSLAADTLSDTGKVAVASSDF